jgi:hypothetical protein
VYYTVFLVILLVLYYNNNEIIIPELRKKTLTSTWQQPNRDHEHEFDEPVQCEEDEGTYV